MAIKGKTSRKERFHDENRLLIVLKLCIFMQMKIDHKGCIVIASWRHHISDRKFKQEFHAVDDSNDCSERSSIKRIAC